VTKAVRSAFRWASSKGLRWHPNELFFCNCASFI
jgi:hypothetical protein